MTKMVVVPRRGQTTIPMEVRKQLGIKEGSKLMVAVEGHQGIMTKVPSVFDLAGTSSMGREQAFKDLDRMREED